MESVLRVLEIIGIGLSVLSIALLGAAGVAHLRRPRAAQPHRISTRARRAQAVVASTLLIGAVCAAVRGVPLGYGWVTLIAAGLMLLLLRRDERFWVALAPLMLVFTGIGAVLLLAMSHNYGQPGGDLFWYGGRQLVAWGGLRANPSVPGWELSIVALAILRYGLPLALVLTTTWLVSVRTSMTRVERLGLVSAAEGVFVTVLLGAAVSIIVLSAGLLYGLPIPLVVLGVAGGVFTFVTVGPGAVAGLIVGGRTLASRVPEATGVATLVSSVDTLGGSDDADAAGPDPASPVRSLARFVKGELSPMRRWNLKALGVVVAWFVVAAIGGAAFGRVDDARPVDFEPITTEVGAGFKVAEFRRGADDDVWLLGESGELALFDMERGEVVHIDLRVSSLAVVDGHVHALTRATRPRVVVLEPGRPTKPTRIVTLPEGTTGHLAIDEGAIYVADPEGPITRYSRQDGTPQAFVADVPAVLVVAARSEVWTLHPVADQLTQPYRLVPRDPQTLTVRGDPAGVNPLGFSSGEREVDRRIQRVVTGRAHYPLDDNPPRYLRSTPEVVWRAEGVGELYRLERDSETRFDFHYDRIDGVIESRAGTWLLVIDDRGTIIDTTEVSESQLVLWEDGPASDGAGAPRASGAARREG